MGTLCANYNIKIQTLEHNTLWSVKKKKKQTNSCSSDDFKFKAAESQCCDLRSMWITYNCCAEIKLIEIASIFISIVIKSLWESDINWNHKLFNPIEAFINFQNIPRDLDLRPLYCSASCDPLGSQHTHLCPGPQRLLWTPDPTTQHITPCWLTITSSLFS